MRNMKLGVVACALVVNVAGVSLVDGSQQWIQLFNGEDLTGWTPKITGYALGDNLGDTFRVEDGVLKVAYDAYDTFDDRFPGRR